MIFFFNDTATTEIYTLTLHDALPISQTENERTFPQRLASTRQTSARVALRCSRTSGPKCSRTRLPRWTFGAPCADRKSTRLNSSHANISYAVFCLKKKRRGDTQDKAE